MKRVKVKTVDFEGHPLHIYDCDLTGDDYDGFINIATEELGIRHTLPERQKLSTFFHEICEECYWDKLSKTTHDKNFEVFTRRVFGVLVQNGFINENFFKSKKKPGSKG